MPAKLRPADWVIAVSQRVREREMQRQILRNRIHKGVGPRAFWRVHFVRRASDLLLEFLKLLVASILGLGIIAELIGYFSGVNPLYILAGFGLFYSLQATYYKYRLARDPNYKVPRCQCADHRYDDTEAVLRSDKGVFRRIPTSATGILLYAAILVLVYFHGVMAAFLLAALGVSVSVYLGYQMLVGTSRLCGLCINIMALNLLVLGRMLYQIAVS